MKKLLYLFISLQLISGNSFAEELSKLPALFIHFGHHQHQEHNTTFSAFIVNHYSGHQHSDSEPDHEHLPLKHCADHCAHQVLVQSIPEYFYINFQVNLLPLDHTINHTTGSTLSFSGSIFQPPRLV